MATHDDDLTNHDAEETFEFDDQNEEFSVPDTPYGDDDSNAFSEVDDFLGDDELDDGSVIEGGDEFSIGEEESADDAAEYQELDQDGYESSAEEDEFEGNASTPGSLGWKAYTGIAAALVLTAGGMVTFLFPGDSSQNTRQVQAMDPAQLQQMAQQRNSGQSSEITSPRNSVAPASNQSAVGQEPVKVQAFPDSDHQPAMANRSDNADSSQSSPIADPNADGYQQDSHSFEQINNQRGLAMLDQQIEEVGSKFFVRKDEFSVLGSVVDRNKSTIESMERTLSVSKRDIKTLQRRVAELEKNTGHSTSTPEKKVKPDPEVKKAQIILAAYGYAPGKIDGLMGVRTKAAITRFQKAHEIDVSGELNQATQDKMNDDPKRNPYPLHQVAQTSQKRSDNYKSSSQSSGKGWFIRGVTANRAIVFKKDGTSYAVEHGTEIPGMGQVIAFYPQKREIKTSKGMIKEL